MKKSFILSIAILALVSNTVLAENLKSTGKINNDVINQAKTSMIKELKTENTANSKIIQPNSYQDVDFASFVENCASEIENNWILPEGVKEKPFSISAQIDEGGNITDVKLIKSSGKKYIDESAIEAVNKISPVNLDRSILFPLKIIIRCNPNTKAVQIRSSN